MGSMEGRPEAAPARDYPEGPAEASEGQNIMVAVDQESGVAITGHSRHIVSEPRNTNPEIDTVRGSTGSESLATVADGSASRMVPDGKSPKVIGGADLSINSKGYKIKLEQTSSPRITTMKRSEWILQTESRHQYRCLGLHTYLNALLLVR